MRKIVSKNDLFLHKINLTVKIVFLSAITFVMRNLWNVHNLKSENLWVIKWKGDLITMQLFTSIDQFLCQLITLHVWNQAVIAGAC